MKIKFKNISGEIMACEKCAKLGLGAKFAGESHVCVCVRVYEAFHD